MLLAKAKTKQEKVEDAEKTKAFLCLGKGKEKAGERGERSLVVFGKKKRKESKNKFYQHLCGSLCHLSASAVSELLRKELNHAYSDEDARKASACHA